MVELPGRSEYYNAYMFARKANDKAFQTNFYSHSSGSNRVLWHVFDDRKLYKPKETVHVKGYVRKYELQVNLFYY